METDNVSGSLLDHGSGHHHGTGSVLGHPQRNLESTVTSPRNWELSGTSQRNWESSGSSPRNWESTGTLPRNWGHPGHHHETGSHLGHKHVRESLHCPFHRGFLGSRDAFIFFIFFLLFLTLFLLFILLFGILERDWGRVPRVWEMRNWCLRLPRDCLIYEFQVVFTISFFLENLFYGKNHI